VIRARAAPPTNIARRPRLRGRAAESGDAVALMGTETSCVGRLGHGRRLDAGAETAYLRKDIHVDQLGQGRACIAGTNRPQGTEFGSSRRSVKLSSAHRPTVRKLGG
jgi:hypothetical protein